MRGALRLYSCLLLCLQGVLSRLTPVRIFIFRQRPGAGLSTIPFKQASVKVKI
jgi:hypothetical protein